MFTAALLYQISWSAAKNPSHTLCLNLGTHAHAHAHAHTHTHTHTSPPVTMPLMGFFCGGNEILSRVTHTHTHTLNTHTHWRGLARPGEGILKIFHLL